MPLTFRKSFTILPGVRLNVNRKSLSLTLGRNGAHRTWSTTGRTTTSADLPGPFGYRRTTRRG
ncbi:DUF4236 domain-containing protein [Streptacidiphilus sp. ASG 303]|uniref:DUF4236 domain-containing protein n=1 Tax=Streptomycetaceae TaxID=2062 RepID=UPI001E44ED01|nr:DUF4236 domain-containing protein [Streptacidiphilus sp. ASG 303]MCD0481012.1 DUF4236 domain-containing protein [Streptacidiphilus sp. ASG 303]